MDKLWLYSMTWMVYNLGKPKDRKGLGQQLTVPIYQAKNDPTQGFRVIALTNKFTVKGVSTTGWSSSP